jgi:DNA-binding CsgD family transcriptional regulator
MIMRNAHRSTVNPSAPASQIGSEQVDLVFELGGTVHRLMQRSAWPAQAGAGGSTSEVVGQMVFRGEQHLILRAGPCSGEEDAIAPLSKLLTRREIEIAVLMAEGLCDKQIARALGISCHTVREHTRRVMCKLKVGKRTAIVSYVVTALGSLNMDST